MYTNILWYCEAFYMLLLLKVLQIKHLVMQFIISTIFSFKKSLLDYMPQNIQ